ncbi:MAG: CPXCG motif-containing cysteine-rich protein [Planctomycetes bacterium]|nr:CPXCG motif-containing cysteine-rich protein [Planctomycetota bacterium]
MDETGTYICDSCGEEIEVSLDPSAGRDQRYVEDCPVCCVPNELHVSWDEYGAATIRAERE